MTPTTTDARLLTPDQAADLLAVSRETLKDWRQEGRGPACVPLSARTIRYRERDLLAFIDEQMQPLRHAG